MPGQSFYVKEKNKDVAGKIISVADEIDMETGLFRVGLSFTQEIKTFQKAIVVYVNTNMLTDAIRISNDILNKEGDDYVVWVAEAGRARKRIVTVKQRDGYGAIIEKGLKEGDVFIVQGFTQLLENDKLNVLNILASKEI